ncbi:DUF2235 domain-containing protein [Thioalkalivibrio sp. ALgr3]|uniref:DUF2235 domain-containing protein n=1 Tax=Thioalkalivibrio sp. ALgr3 TaxID=1239292 RepID=UPI000364D4D4|nr:DUF2235 domain-containing protein [Thioalkalivibrio sp. ALgr3]
MERNIVFCCDGTANQKGEVNTNVVHLLRRIPTTARQVSAYEPGVGTFSPFGMRRENIIGTTLGKLFGHGLTANIENGYRFLMQQVREGDRVYLFGFSRGAYAVRALSGMLRKCGLLQPGREDLVSEASRLYTGRHNEDEAARFRKQHSRPCPVHFIGAWDTVGSLGYLYRNRRFFDTRLSPEVTHARHALAIDERRPKFEALLWDDTRVESGQTLKQLWFPGAHADVGGGYEQRQLAEIALQWMLEEAAEAGLIVKEPHEPAIAPDPAGPIHEPWNTWAGRTLRLLHLGDRPRDVPPDALHPSAKARHQALGYRPELFTQHTPP